MASVSGSLVVDGAPVGLITQLDLAIDTDYNFNQQTWSKQFTNYEDFPNDVRIGNWMLKKSHVEYAIRRPNTISDYYTENFIRYTIYQDSIIRVLAFDGKRNKVLVQFTKKLEDWLDESILDDYCKVDLAAY